MPLLDRAKTAGWGMRARCRRASRASAPPSRIACRHRRMQTAGRMFTHAIGKKLIRPRFALLKPVLGAILISETTAGICRYHGQSLAELAWIML
eukprot:6556373-Pyramimonas_sp.AAC.1